MRVLVTGGLGFIGSHLVERLVDEGNSVYVVDNLHTGTTSNIPLEHRKKLEKWVHYIELGIRRFQDVDLIIHLGMPSSSPMYKENPLLVAEVIKEGIMLLRKAVCDKSKFILISSSSVYNGNNIPFKEGMRIIPTDYYTEARYYLERLTKLYSKLHGLEAVILRLFSVYGEKEECKGKYANIVTQFMWDFINDRHPVIYGDGNQTRDFIYVGDVVDAIIKAIDYSDWGITPCEIFNVGTGVNYSFNEVISILQTIFNKYIKPKYIENPISNYVYHTLADTAKARCKLKFRAKTSLSEGIRKIKPYYELLFGG